MAPSMVDYRAPSLFQPHRARQAILDAHTGKIPPLLGLYLGLSTVQTARFMAPMGFDMVWVDWEHSACDVETMTTMCHEIMFMSEGKTIPFVRVPGHDHAAIGFALDCGASIVIPQLETVEQAKHVVSSAKFGTKQNGTRSAPPFRFIPGLTDTCIDQSRGIHENLNDQAAIMVQIETLQGIHNLDAILTEVPDIDIVWLGTLDARVSMNLPANGGMGGTEKEWVDAVAEYERVLTKHNKPRAGFAFGPSGKQLAAEKSLIVISSDVMTLMACMGDLANGRENYTGKYKTMEVINGVAKEEEETTSTKEEIVNGAPKVNNAVNSQ
ncbi:MAG: hypothetical protein M1834_004858 [Cirrosporium novae-zelandiae]|nr:MAG: hypothetical protein M1834_004858 [Cirrosporium novae-zelandiae]